MNPTTNRPTKNYTITFNFLKDVGFYVCANISYEFYNPQISKGSFPSGFSYVRKRKGNHLVYRCTHFVLQLFLLSLPFNNEEQTKFYHVLISEQIILRVTL